MGSRPHSAAVGAGAMVAALVLVGTVLVVIVALPAQGPADSIWSRAMPVAYVLGFGTIAVAGAVLLHRRPADRMGRLLVAAGLGQLLSLLVAGLVPLLETGGGAPPVALWLTNWLWIPAQVAVLLVLLRLPDGNLAGPRWRVLEWVVVVWGILAVLVTAFLPGPLGSSSLEHRVNPFGWDAAGAALSALLGPLFLVLPVLNLLAASALVWRWRRSDAVNRQRLRWIAAAAIVAAVAAPLAWLGSASGDLALAIAMLLVCAAVAVSVLRRRLWEVGVVSRSGLAAIAVAGPLLAGYAAAVRWIPGDEVPVVAGLVAGVLAVPLHRLARRILDRFLLGTDGDPAVVAAALRSQLTAGPSDTLRETAVRLRRTLRLPWVGFEGDDGEILAASGPDLPGAGRERIGVPVVTGGMVVGRLVAAERTPGEGLSPRDLGVLGEVATAAALVVRSVQVDQRLADSRERLGTVRAQERARLQRDLHDGLGPVLGGITMRAEAAHNLLGAGADPERVSAQLDRIGADSEQAVAEIRRLIQELRPTALGEAGVAEAIRQAVATAAEGIPCALELDLPADLNSRTEVALYRIVVEAVRNAARHADAHTLEVRATSDGDDLLVTITDDGRGLRGSTPGVGIRAMTERATELGGSLTVGPAGATGTGTRVTARLPLLPEES